MLSRFAAILLAAVLFADTAVSAETGKPEKDLSGQFPDEACRDQGDIGACHSFASIALLEAALHRIEGGHQRLSEADLFLQHMARNPSFFKALETSGIQGLRTKMFVSMVAEGGFAKEDIGIALGAGVAPAALYSWKDLEMAYVNYLKHFDVSVWTQLAKSGDNALVDPQTRGAKIAAAEDWFAKRDMLGRNDPSFGRGSDTFASIRAKQYADIRKDGDLRYYGAKSFKEWIAARVDAAEESFADDLYLGRGAIDAARKKMKKRFDAGRARLLAYDYFDQEELRIEEERRELIKKGVKPLPPRPEPVDAFKISDPAKCRAAGARRAAMIKALIDKNVPVAVGVNIAGVPGWNNEKTTGWAGHEFVLSGYRHEKGRLVFLSRNSWDGVNPPVHSDWACRIAFTTIVATGKDGLPAVPPEMQALR